MPKRTIMQKISDEEFAEIVKNSLSMREVVFACGYHSNTGANNRIIKNRITRQNLDISHFKITKTPIVRSDEEIFIENSPVSQTTLRRHYIIGQYSEYKCSICGQEPFWNGKELTLTLDHKNGKNNDDRLENLRWVCPNCDRQLDTFAGRNQYIYIDNKPIIKEKKCNYCIDCGKEILLSSTRCPECSTKMNGLKQRKVERPSRNEFKQMIRTIPFLQIGKKYSMTDNGVRKWCDSYGLPRTKKEIEKYTQEEWDLL